MQIAAAAAIAAVVIALVGSNRIVRGELLHD